ncbi:hypothetical protein VNI00_000145 [Paramarasmius palmivorus]|uniref:Uncharacterized protein n=1 Tax=Paramarasmius palmivorus TaxID=297713 RepID=A0AAW0EGH7_9AGAR
MQPQVPEAQSVTQAKFPVDHAPPPTTPVPPAHQMTERPPHFGWGKGFETWEQQRVQWEQERDRLMNRAQETMTEMSEATLESLSSTIEALRAKLAEHKVEKEKQQKILEQELEEKKRNPPRWV